MKRERLQKLFSEDKEIFQGGMLFPTWICKGKEEIENRKLGKIPILDVFVCVGDACRNKASSQ